MHQKEKKHRRIEEHRENPSLYSYQLHQLQRMFSPSTGYPFIPLPQTSFPSRKKTEKQKLNKHTKKTKLLLQLSTYIQVVSAVECLYLKQNPCKLQKVNCILTNTCCASLLRPLNFIFHSFLHFSYSFSFKSLTASLAISQTFHSSASWSTLSTCSCSFACISATCFLFLFLKSWFHLNSSILSSNWIASDFHSKALLHPWDGKVALSELLILTWKSFQLQYPQKIVVLLCNKISISYILGKTTSNRVIGPPFPTFSKFFSLLQFHQFSFGLQDWWAISLNTVIDDRNFCYWWSILLNIIIDGRTFSWICWCSSLFSSSSDDLLHLWCHLW